MVFNRPVEIQNDKGSQRVNFLGALQEMLRCDSVASFDPELVIISFGTDAHGKDAGVCGIGGLETDDFGIMIDEVIRVAGKGGSCRGILAILEGGYGIEGGPLGTLARSILSMVCGEIEAETHYLTITAAWLT